MGGHQHNSPSASPSPPPWCIWTPTPIPTGERWLVRSRQLLGDIRALSDSPVPDLLYACFDASATGQVTLTHGTRQERLCFVQGQLASLTTGPSPSRDLGRLLFERGILTEDSYYELKETLDETGQGWSELLTRRSLLDPHTLYELITEVELERALNCFGWTEGYSQFTPDSELAQKAVPLPVETPRIILDGLQRHYDVRRLSSLFDIPDTARPRLRTAELARQQILKLALWETKLLEAARRRLTLGEILRDAPVDAHRARLFFAGLFLMKLIGFELPRKTGSARRGASVSELDPRCASPVSPRPQHWSRPNPKRPWHRATKPRWDPDLERKATKIEAERLFSKARQDLYAKRPEDAVEKLRQAIKLNHREIKFEVWFAWALYLTEPDENLRTAKRRLDTAERRAPRSTELHLVYARIFESEGELVHAYSRFHRALSLAESDLNVQREVQLFEFRLRRGRPRTRECRSWKLDDLKQFVRENFE